MAEHLSLPDEAATLRLGAALAAGAAGGTGTGGLVLHLKGELGSGKTTLARGLIQALGHSGRVKSPTYTLLEPYSLLRLNLYHFDFYRFKDRSEWLSSGFREYFNPESLCIVEWPERAGDLLAPPDLEIQLRYTAQARTAVPVAHSERGIAWLATALSRWRSSSA
jgi:tRNA threonylcarbamoyladenosine biosynthesis protein TsaE